MKICIKVRVFNFSPFSITTEPPLIPDLVLKNYSKLDSIVITEEEVIDN